MKAVAAWFATLAIASSAVAQERMRTEDLDLSDWGHWAVLGSAAFGCYDSRGVRARIVADNSIDSIGWSFRRDGRPYIVMKPARARQYSNITNWWWFAHECAHLALPSSQNGEPAADCWAIKVLRDRGHFGDENLTDLDEELYDLEESEYGHLAGPDRIALIKDCYFGTERLDPAKWPELGNFQYDNRDVDRLVTDI